MKFEHTEVWGFEHAIRGMRNPKNSWNKSDSCFCTGMLSHPCQSAEECAVSATQNVQIGENDLKLMQTLIKSGSEHRKFLRQIFVSCDITAPMYWFAEFDTYKVGTVANSTSKMHKLASTPITIDCFEYSSDFVVPIFNEYIETLESLRIEYNTTKNKEIWKAIIQLLPESWLQKRTVTMNYENLLGMCSAGQRRFHKLNEWSGKDNPELPNFISWARTLPYAQELIFIDEIKE